MTREKWSNLTIEEWSNLTGIKEGSTVRFTEGVWDAKEKHPKYKVKIGKVDQLWKSPYGGIAVFFTTEGETGRSNYSTMSQDVKMELIPDGNTL